MRTEDEILRGENQSRLAQLPYRDIKVIALDIHGFLKGGGADHRELNESNLDALAAWILQGNFLVAATGYGDSIHHEYIDPLRARLESQGKIDSLPFYIATRNGALTQHGLTGEVIDSHPLDATMYDVFLQDPIIQALHNLTPKRRRVELAKERAKKSNLGLQAHPYTDHFPNARLDFCATTNYGYQFTLIYEPSRIDPGSTEEIYAIRKFCNGELPSTPHDLAPYLQQYLEDQGIRVGINTAGSHPELDLAVPGMNKAIGLDALRPQMARHLGIDVADVAKYGIGGGDSPLHNDKPLMKYFELGGVTNIDYYEENGPIVLSYAGVTDPIARTNHFLWRLLGENEQHK